jgi:acetylornithine deacetylase/succinyl-diaminopimelate desuccinylase-like protein
MSVDWDRLEFEAVDLLSRYVRVDTSNPPGRERAACDFLGSVLERENIPFELFDAGNDRVSLRAELSGNGTERPFMLLNHTDVVPAEAEFWTEPPFSGAIKDGYVWGRGALDMKGLGIVQLLVLATLKREGVPLARDVVYFAQADEEAGSEFGMRWIVRNHPETLDAEFVINEGGGGLTEMFGVTQPVFTVAVGEKSPVWLQLTTEGQPGHGSLPHEDNSLERLVRALAQIQEWDSDWVVTPPVATYFQGLKQGRILKSDVDEQAIRSLARRDQRVKALLASTISATTASAGIKHNVIPARSEATLDCRLRPGVKP